MFKRITYKMSLAFTRQRNKIRNPKHERSPADRNKPQNKIRSTKFETNRSQISQNPSNSKTRNPNHGCLEHCICFSHLNLFRISDFVLRNFLSGISKLRFADRLGLAQFRFAEHDVGDQADGERAADCHCPRRAEPGGEQTEWETSHRA